MPEIQKVTDPNKVVTDPVVLSAFKKQGIDPEYVEFYQDYAPRSLGKGHSPYAKFYRDLKSNKRFMVVSGLPMVDADGVKIEAGWLSANGKCYSKANLFSAIVEGKQVKLTCLSDQPTGAKKGDRVVYKPQLFVDGSEIVNGEQATLLPIDPVNEGYKENTLEWTYGAVCKRRIRLIEGRFREHWLFESNPYSSVRIKHNFVGNLKLKLGYAVDANGNSLKVSVIGDEEIVEANKFDKAVFPVEIGATLTVYPDADPETSSVDGEAYHADENATWATIHNGAGTNASDASDHMRVRWETGTTAGRYNWLIRALILFDTSSLPDAATITAAILSLYGEDKVDTAGCGDLAFNVYSSNPANNNAIVAGDYDSLGTTAYATAIAYNDWNVGTPGSANDFTFNATGKAAISKTGITKLGVREVTHDVGDSAPSSPGSVTYYGGCKIWSADKGTGYKPKLVVTYTTSTEQAVGGGAVAIAGTLSRNIFTNTGEGAVGIAGLLSSHKRYLQNVGSGAVTITSTLATWYRVMTQAIWDFFTWG